MKIRVLIVLAVTILLGACMRSETDGSDNGNRPTDKRNLPLLVKGISQEGKLIIKVTPEMADMLSCDAAFSLGEDGSMDISTQDAALSRAMSNVGAYKMRRVYRDAGRFEQRQRKAGLHLWYEISFDPDMDLVAAADKFVDIEGITFIEGDPIIRREVPEAVVATEVPNNNSYTSGDGALRAPAYFFNDPWLPSQWHYQNLGDKPNYVSGADINLFPAWGIETGKPEVIVAVADGGVDYRHQDLAANMWINELEKNGTPGVDDDNNGFIDDIYGYNFYSDSGTINPEMHGTHVAGTVAAVNNNGLGVSGVAGGDGTPGSGVRIMSIQYFYGPYGYNIESSYAQAMVYAANNGAVISQNSWSDMYQRPLSAAVKSGIDYFIQNAGMDETGEVQVGPMKGGIVIFAAGNSSSGQQYMPGAYEGTFGVVAMGPDFKLGSYSNYGSWLQVTAPGGENIRNETQVLSTFPDNQYGWIYGTSMACPHVSGIAALVVSKYGTAEKGFTNTQLWNLLLASTHNIDQYNPLYAGQMGAGYIDAYMALRAGAIGNEPAPNPVNDLDIVWMFDGARLNWTIPAELGSGKAARYDVIWSETNLNGANFDNLPEGTSMRIVRVNGESVGDMMTTKLTGLQEGKTYYVGIAAVDGFGNRSSITTKSGVTVANRPPQVDGLPSNISLKAAEQRSIPLRIYDIEEYDWIYSFVAGSSAATIKKDNSEQLTLTFNCTKAQPGSYTAKLTLRDEQGLENVININYTINENHTPVAVSQNTVVALAGSGATETLDMNTLFTDEDEDVLKYEVKIADPSLASLSKNPEGNILTIKSKKSGSSNITITAIDPIGAKAECIVRVTSGAVAQQLTLYPVPVKADGVLNIRIGNTSADVDVAIYNTSNGARVMTQRVTITADEPGQLNMSRLPSGNYRVVVDMDGTQISKNITKL